MDKQEAVKTDCLAIDLVDDEELIARYEYYHQKENIWPEIVAGIRSVGIRKMDIFRTGNRLVMIIERPASVDLKSAFERMGRLPRQQEWAELMETFQKRIASAGPGEQWVLMMKIFDLND